MGNKKSKPVYIQAVPISQVNPYSFSLYQSDISAKPKRYDREKIPRSESTKFMETPAFQPYMRHAASAPYLTEQQFQQNIEGGPGKKKSNNNCCKNCPHTSQANGKILMTDPPYWYSPCGTRDQRRVSVDSTVYSEYIQSILLVIYQALNHMLAIREDYCLSVFSVSFSSMCQMYGSQRYPWLPEMPKQVGETTPGVILPLMTFQIFTANAYTNLQTYAVGMEEVAWDASKHNRKVTKFDNAKQFYEVNERIRVVLCTMYVAMSDEDISIPNPVPREKMPESERNPPTQSTADLRDFIIFKEYLNGLEFFRDVYEYLRTRNSV